jgi:peptidoglycan/LPS O-acetylase OafA/YrhL
MPRDLFPSLSGESSNSYHATPSNVSNPTYRADIDGLRAVAVLSVVGFHAFPFWLKGGFAGVDIFFVISGFLISSIIFGGLDQGNFSFKEFYIRRIRRIFPALLAVLAACYAFGWFALLGKEFEQLGKHIAAGASFISNFVLWNEVGYFDNAADTKPLLHLWSLGIEEQFYIMWPLLAWFVWKRRISMMTVTLLLIFISFAINLHFTGADSAAAFYLPLSRFWELSCGSLLAYFMLRRHAPNRLPAISSSSLEARFLDWTTQRKNLFNRELAALTGMALIVAALLLLSKEKNFPGWWALLPTAGACLIIASGQHAWINRRILANSLLVKIGLISYPLYLWHWPLLSFARIIEGETPSREIRIGAVILSIALAWLTYRLIEIPLRFGARTKTKVSVLILSMFMLGLIGHLTSKQHGFAFRLKAFEEKVKEVKRSRDSTPECKNAIPVKDLRYCNLADTSRSPSVVVIGDSHGNRLYESLAAKYDSLGENLLQIGGGGCLPFWDIETGSPGQPNKCHEQMNPQLDYVLNNPNIKTVIFANRGPLHIEGNDPASGRKYFVKDMVNVDVQDAKQIYKQALLRSTAKLKEKGKNVVLIIDAPEFPYDPLQCINLDRPFASPFKNRPDCKISRTAVDQRNLNYIEVTMQVANSLELKVINLQDVLCDAENCHALKDGNLMYMDPDHLNPRGARYVIERQWPQFPH